MLDANGNNARDFEPYDNVDSDIYDHESDNDVMIEVEWF